MRAAARAAVLTTLAACAAAQLPGRAEGEGFGAQTWLSRCLADATGLCAGDTTAANFLDPTQGADATLALDLTSSGPHATPYATHPFRSNDGLRSGESTYQAKFRGRMHSALGVPGTDAAVPLYGRGGTQQLPAGQVGGQVGGFNNFNQGGSFTTLDSMFQRPTASFPGDREMVTADATDYSGTEHGLFRCTASTSTAWTAAAIEIGGVKYDPPLQGGSARFMMQTIDFAAGTNCDLAP